MADSKDAKATKTKREPTPRQQRRINEKLRKAARRRRNARHG